MSGHTKTVSSVKPSDHAVGGWFKKWFLSPVKSIPRLDADYDARDYYQLDLSDSEPLEASVTLPDGITFHTVILRLGAGGFTCKIPAPVGIPGNQPISILFALPLEEPVLMEEDALLTGQTVNGSPNSRLGQFRFSHSMDEEDRERIHRFVMDQQLEMIRRERRLGVSLVE